jgi:hypothetical protein
MAALARAAGIRLGDINSFQRWLMRCAERHATWRVLHYALRGVRFGET